MGRGAGAMTELSPTVIIAGITGVAGIFGTAGTAFGWWLKYRRSRDSLALRRELAAVEQRSKEKAEEAEEKAYLRARVSTLEQRLETIGEKIREMEARHDAEMERERQRHAEELRHVHKQKHEAQNKAQGYALFNVVLKNEVNALLKELSRDAKYLMSEAELLLGTLPGTEPVEKQPGV
jgi:hypothetical protein